MNFKYFFYKLVSFLFLILVTVTGIHFFQGKIQELPFFKKNSSTDTKTQGKIHQGNLSELHSKRFSENISDPQSKIESHSKSETEIESKAEIKTHSNLYQNKHTSDHSDHSGYSGNTHSSDNVSRTLSIKKILQDLTQDLTQESVLSSVKSLHFEKEIQPILEDLAVTLESNSSLFHSLSQSLKSCSLQGFPYDQNSFLNFLKKKDQKKNQSLQPLLETWSFKEGSKTWRLHRRLKETAERSSDQYEWLLFDLDEQGYPQQQEFTPEKFKNPLLVSHHQKTLGTLGSLTLEYDWIDGQILSFQASSVQGKTLVCSHKTCNCF
jgi:paraquat-inducible protein B